MDSENHEAAPVEVQEAPAEEVKVEESAGISSHNEVDPA